MFSKVGVKVFLGYYWIKTFFWTFCFAKILRTRKKNSNLGKYPHIFRDRASVDSKMLPSLRSLFRIGDFVPKSEQCGELVEDCNFGSKKCACISGDFLWHNEYVEFSFFTDWFTTNINFTHKIDYLHTMSLFWMFWGMKLILDKYQFYFCK